MKLRASSNGRHGVGVLLAGIWFLNAAITAPILAASSANPAVADAIARADQGLDPIPGPRSCCWARGPASADPHINIACPDAATFYWAAAFTIPTGAQLYLTGEFPHARYMSLISYDAAGVPIESVADYLIAPEQGSANPFLDGADRSSGARGCRLAVVGSPPLPGQPVGMNLRGITRAELHAPHYGAAPGQQVMLYRIYANDRGRDETGGCACARSRRAGSRSA